MATKAKLHPRNQHAEGYDFERLVAQTPELEAFVILRPGGHENDRLSGCRRRSFA